MLICWKRSWPQPWSRPPPSGRAACDPARLRAERRRSRESGLIALARQNRDRRDHLFATLEAEWLNGGAGGFLQEVAALEETLAGDQPSG